MEYISSALEHSHPYPPIVLLVGGNKTANKAIKKGSTYFDSLIIAQASITTIFCWLQRQSKIAVDSTYSINPHDNKFADNLSHAALHTWVSKLQTTSAHDLLHYTLLPQTKEHSMSTLSYQRLIPSPDLMSTILRVVLNPMH
jgi:hypothetical protein